MRNCSLGVISTFFFVIVLLPACAALSVVGLPPQIRVNFAFTSLRNLETHKWDRLDKGVRERPLRRALPTPMAGMSQSPVHHGLGIGFDFGTSGARINLVDAQSLGVVFAADVQYEQQSTQVWTDALCQLLDQIPSELRDRVKRISVSGTSASVVVVDRSSRKSTRGPRMYDFSAVDAPGGLSAIDAISRFAPNSHTVRSSTSTLAKILAWHTESPFQENERICHQADFLSMYLRGSSDPIVTDWNNVLKLGYDIQTLQYPSWIAHLLESHSISADVLPKVVRPGESCGCISQETAVRFSLPPTCEVVAGTTDSISAFIASRASAPGEAVTSMGSTLAIKILSKVLLDYVRVVLKNRVHQLRDPSQQCHPLPVPWALFCALRVT